MRKLGVFNHVSLDGYFVDQHGEMSWAHANQQDEEWNAFVAQNAGGGGMLVLGRVTYELMAGFWPTPAALETMPVVAERMNNLPKVLFSRTMDEAAWNNTTLIKGELAAAVRELKSMPGEDMVILGSGSIVAQLAQAGLIDEYQLVVKSGRAGRGQDDVRRRPGEAKPQVDQDAGFWQWECLAVLQTSGVNEQHTVQAHHTAEMAARRSYGKLVAILAAHTHDVMAAEDALSEAFAAALAGWPLHGPPPNPEAWLVTVARRKLIDGARRSRSGEHAIQQLQILAQGQEDEVVDLAIPDQRLALLFACAHPAIETAIRAPLMLQAVLGLTAKEIAPAFLLAPAAMGKRLVRPRRRSARPAFLFASPHPMSWPGGSTPCWRRSMQPLPKAGPTPAGSKSPAAT